VAIAIPDQPYRVGSADIQDASGALNPQERSDQSGQRESRLRGSIALLSLPKTLSAWVAALTESEHDPGR
jgi:hypothetical protein